MKRILILSAILLAGCASRPAWLENRAACTVDGNEAHALSKWGLFSIGARLSDSDAAMICKR